MKNVIIVDYSKTTEQMVQEGDYVFVNGNAWYYTSRHFPIIGEGIVEYEFKIFQPNCFITFDSGVKYVQNFDLKKPWEPAKIEHMLAVGINFPEEQCKFMIAALGSVATINNNDYFPGLIGNETERSLIHFLCNYGLNYTRCLLGIRRI